MRFFRSSLAYRGVWHRRSAEPVLGTRFSLQILCSKKRTADDVFAHLQAEVERLENIFSVYRLSSSLSQWKSSPTPSTLSVSENGELCEVLTLAEYWRTKTGGCFTPLADEFTHAWRHGEASQIVPTVGELDVLRHRVAIPRYHIDDSGNVKKTGDCSNLSLHAIAKGWIVDRAAEVAIQDPRVSAVLVNIGGDLRLCGAEEQATSTIALENPLRAYDNEAPLCRIQLASGGLATSGGSRRGFTIGEKWYSHVIDPRTGYPVNRVASASVFAPTATTADAIATMLSVIDPTDGLAIAAALVAEGTFPEKSLGCLIVDRAGHTLTNAVWDEAMVES